MAVKSAIKRYQANFRAEQEGSLLYQELANTVLNGKEDLTAGVA